jgi:thymidylate synthase (FAD)
MEQLKGKVIQVLDHGSVELMDWMGDDSAIVCAARMSTGGSTKTPQEDERLIEYLMEMSHTSPFEMCEIKFKIKTPLFISKQWVRHRMASVNEFSARYSEMPDDFYVPETFRTQSKINHQASEGNLDDETNQKLSETTQAYTEDTYKLYKFMLEKGVSREMARIVLPVSTYTQFVWKIDLHNLLKFLRLRMDPTAQEEIRVYADVIWDIVKIWVPMTAKAFEEFQLQSMTFSGKETKLLRQLMRQVPQQVIQNLVDESGLKKRSKEKFLSL